MRAALYARVSRADQQTLPEQLDQMRDYCKARGWEVAHEFQEMMSGKKDSRPERKKLMLLAHQRKVDVVIVWKLDRWGRGIRDTVVTTDELLENGCALVSITQNIDSSTTSGKILRFVFALIAEIEHDQLIERTHLGLERARKAGKVLGRRPTPALYKQEVLDFHAEGLSPAKIAAAMDKRVSEATVRRIIKDA